MANVDNDVSVYNDKMAISQKNPTKVLIITSGDGDDDDKILSYLNPTNVETIMVDLNNTNLIDINQINNKRETQIFKISNLKRRKADLTCVVCGGHASGYNFDQISCESCKAFFRRNALHSIEETKCLNQRISLNGNRCNVRYNIRHKCQHCRLLKCLGAGMRKDFILTPQEKQLKKQRLEENRRLRTTPSNSNANHIKTEHIDEPPVIYTKCEAIIVMSSYLLTNADWSCLQHIQNAYLSASQSSPSASSVISLDLAPDKMSAYMNTLDIQNFAAVKLINFIRQIPEFDGLDERDRLILVKYNLSLLFILRHALAFDTTREICYEEDMVNPVSPSEEAFAQHYKSLFILCYGYEFNRLFVSILRTIINVVDKDPIIVQLVMLSMIFLKGLSVNDDQEPILNDVQRVFYAQSKYTDLLFRYLLQKSSFDVAVLKMMRIVEVFIKIQRLIRDFQQYLKSNIDVNYVNPLMKSLLHLT